MPLKEGAKVYITGPTANNSVAQCGGWTMGWIKSYSSTIKGVTTIRKAFEQYAADYGITVLTDEAAALGKPTVTCIIAGRNLILNEADAANWDSIVMCYLPGSEGKGILDVLCGCADFTGRLPSPRYASVNQIGRNKCEFERGYGLSYPEGFVPHEESAAAAE